MHHHNRLLIVCGNDDTQGISIIEQSLTHTRSHTNDNWTIHHEIGGTTITYDHTLGYLFMIGSELPLLPSKGVTAITTTTTSAGDVLRCYSLNVHNPNSQWQMMTYPYQILSIIIMLSYGNR
jgi:hypothetical protein